MRKTAQHIIQTGPFAGKTIAEKRRLKRSTKVSNTSVSVPQVRGRANRRGRPRGALPVPRANTQEGAIKYLEEMVQGMAGASLKPKEASSFFNGIPGLTMPGRKYLLALTHPNNEECRSFNGIVDSMPDEYNPYVAIDDSVIVTWVPGLFDETPPATVVSYNIHTFFPPIPEIELVYYLSYTAASGALVNSRVEVVRTPGFTQETDIEVANASNIIRTYNTMKDIGYATHRRAGSGRTIIPICSGLNNQGNIVAGQLPDLVGWSDVDGDLEARGNLISVTGSDILSQLGPTQEYNVFKHATVVLPPPSDLTQLDKKCIDIEFKNGAYIPMVPSEPVDTLKKKHTVFSGLGWNNITKTSDGTPVANYYFVASNSFLTVLQQGANGLLDEMKFSSSASLQKNVAAAATLLTPVINSVGNTEQVLTASYLHPGVSEPADMLTGFAYISGLSIQGEASSLPTASIKIRATDYNELYPLSTKPAVAVYRMEHPLRDSAALEMATRIVQVMPHALPSSDNAFNGILGKIWSVVKNVVQPITKFAKFIPLPYAGAVGDLIHEGIDMIDNVGNAGMI